MAFKKNNKASNTSFIHQLLSAHFPCVNIASVTFLTYPAFSHVASSIKSLMLSSKNTSLNESLFRCRSSATKDFCFWLLLLVCEWVNSTLKSSSSTSTQTPLHLHSISCQVLLNPIKYIIFTSYNSFKCFSFLFILKFYMFSNCF